MLLRLRHLLSGRAETRLRRRTYTVPEMRSDVPWTVVPCLPTHAGTEAAQPSPRRGDPVTEYVLEDLLIAFFLAVAWGVSMLEIFVWWPI